MADKKRVKKSIKQLQRVKTWQLVILLMLCALLAATFLRLNNIGMMERRTAVFSADKRKSITETTNNLYALQRYSAAHMNAGSGIIYLEESYKRDVQKAVKAAETTKNDVLERADATCRAQFPGYSQAYVQCNASEQAKYEGSSGAKKLVFPNPELYRHEFESPIWSPDFAGWSLLLCGLIMLLIVARLLGLLLLKFLLRRHYDSI